MPDTTTQPPREDVIGHYWPYDGPHDTDSIASALEAVADLVRTAANATRTPSAVGTGPDGYRVLGGLTIAAEALPQLLSQLGTWAEHVGADASVRHDAFTGSESREMAREDAEQAHELLDIAAQHADKLARLLETAQSSTAHLHHAENAAAE